MLSLAADISICSYNIAVFSVQITRLVFRC